MRGKALIGVAVLGIAALLFVDPFGKHDPNGAGAPDALPPGPVPATDEPSEAREENASTKGEIMDAARCWQLIEATAPEGGAGTEEHADAVAEALRKLEPDEIVAFDQFLHERLEEAYRWDLWAVAYVALGGCGDDSFEYFRLWLVAQGKDYFERALKDERRAVDNLAPGDEAECEALLYAAQEVYESKTGGSGLPSSYSPHKTDPDGEPWSEETVHELYPELAKRFGGG